MAAGDRDVSDQELASLPHVELPEFGRVPVLTRQHFDRTVVDVQGEHGMTFACFGCEGNTELTVYYVKEHGVLVIWCPRCDGVLGAVRVAPDA